jgi:hypothetical protein
MRNISQSERVVNLINWDNLGMRSKPRFYTEERRASVYKGPEHVVSGLDRLLNFGVVGERLAEDAERVARDAKRKAGILAWIAGVGSSIFLGGRAYGEEIQAQPSQNIQTERPENQQRTSYKTDDFLKDDDKTLLARLIWAEARNCGEEERIAVAYTVVNRANDGNKSNGETVKGAALKPWQYSCFNKNDVNRNKLMNPEKYDSKSFYECLDVAGRVLSGEVADPTNGATHYFNPKVVKPKWADKMQRIGRIPVAVEEKGRVNVKPSRHEFYKDN